MASTMAKNMEEKLYALISCLADNYGFNADEAFEFVRWETDIDHVGVITDMLGVSAAPKPEPKKAEAPAPAPVEKQDGSDEKIAECLKHIALWQKKLDEGKVNDPEVQKKKIEKEKAKLAKLQAKSPAPAPKVEEPAKVEPKKEEPKKAEKRMTRLSPGDKKLLIAEFKKAGSEYTDKLGAEYKDYVNNMSNDEYTDTKSIDVLLNFVKLKVGAPAPAPAPVEDSEVEELVKELDSLTGLGGKSNAAGDYDDAPPVVLSIAELQAIKLTVTVPPDGPAEYLYDTEKGRKVVGPEADDDEDFVEIKFEGKDYVVGEKTKRVYEARDTGDIFTGLWLGSGKFKGMKMPST